MVTSELETAPYDEGVHILRLVNYIPRHFVIDLSF
jgi:hypothetical protein